MATYTNTIFNKVFLQSTAFADNQAITKSYVDIELVDLKRDITDLKANKLDNSTNYFKRADGNLQIAENSFLYIGDMWRLRALNGNNLNKPKLVYENKIIVNGQDVWTQAVPFIRPVNI